MNNNINVLCEQYVMGRRITVYGDRQKPLFLAREIADIINHKKASNMVNCVSREEIEKRIIKLAGINRNMLFINEENLYEILTKSRKPIAKPLLKAIKAIIKDIKNENEVEDETDKVLRILAQNPDVGIFFCEALKKQQDKIKNLEEKLKEIKSKESKIKTIELKENTIIITGENAKFEVIKY